MAMGTQWKKDPLSLVREYTIKNEAITLDDKTNELVFDSTRHSKAMLTAYMPSDQGNDGSKKNYTLEQIWLFATKICLEGSSGAEYVKACAQKGIPPIPFKDRARECSAFRPIVDASRSCGISADRLDDSFRCR